jgi:hypothetical protein
LFSKLLLADTATRRKKLQQRDTESSKKKTHTHTPKKTHYTKPRIYSKGKSQTIYPTFFLKTNKQPTLSISLLHYATESTTTTTTTTTFLCCGWCECVPKRAAQKLDKTQKCLAKERSSSTEREAKKKRMQREERKKERKLREGTWTHSP